MKQLSPEVIIIGEFFIDEVLSGFHSLPKLGEESFARKLHREVGGGAAITACGLVVAKSGLRFCCCGFPCDHFALALPTRSSMLTASAGPTTQPTRHPG